MQKSSISFEHLRNASESRDSSRNEYYNNQKITRKKEFEDKKRSSFEKLATLNGKLRLQNIPEKKLMAVFKKILDKKQKQQLEIIEDCKTKIGK